MILCVFMTFSEPGRLWPMMMLLGSGVGVLPFTVNPVTPTGSTNCDTGTITLHCFTFKDSHWLTFNVWMPDFFVLHVSLSKICKPFIHFIHDVILRHTSIKMGRASFKKLHTSVTSARFCPALSIWKLRLSLYQGPGWELDPCLKKAPPHH